MEEITRYLKITHIDKAPNLNLKKADEQKKWEDARKRDGERHERRERNEQYQTEKQNGWFSFINVSMTEQRAERKSNVYKNDEESKTQQNKERMR